ncbi:MAG: GNAT family N-acetyltransferase [Acidobacteria bacterium]|nr:GNAT family N-acetyltransferase [Acidobacteriota bacterium]
MEITTARLSLRPLTLADTDAIHRIWMDAGVRKYLWDDEVISRETASDVVAKSQLYINSQGFGLFGVYTRYEPRLIGFCGYWFFHEPPQLELLYGISTDQWGQGYAAEAAAAMLRYGFVELRFDEVTASTDAANVASLRVLEKLGMSFSKRRESNGLDTIFYALQRQSYHALSTPYAVKRFTPSAKAQANIYESI